MNTESRLSPVDHKSVPFRLLFPRFVPLSGPPGRAYQYHPWLIRLLYQLSQKSIGVWQLFCASELRRAMGPALRQKDGERGKAAFVDWLDVSFYHDEAELRDFLDAVKVRSVLVESWKYEFEYGGGEGRRGGDIAPYWRRSEHAVEFQVDAEEMERIGAQYVADGVWQGE